MKKPKPRILTVKTAKKLSPNMIRVTFSGPELEDFPENREGANCKILIPKPEQTRQEFADQIAAAEQKKAPRPTIRTYTIRAFRKEALEVDIDFVSHGNEGHPEHQGPACAWAQNAKPGSFLGLRGPSDVKIEHYEADYYILAGDMSAMPLLAATLETMPKQAKGVAIFEITHPDDQIELIMPDGIIPHWLIHPDPHQNSTAQLDFLKSIDWPEGRIQTCIAGESGVIKQLRDFILKQKNIAKEDAYISGYWKIGLIEDEHQAIKRLEA